jgi:hypothetical protein
VRRGKCGQVGRRTRVPPPNHRSTTRPGPLKHLAAHASTAGQGCDAHHAGGTTTASATTPSRPIPDVTGVARSAPTAHQGKWRPAPRGAARRCSETRRAVRTDVATDVPRSRGPSGAKCDGCERARVSHPQGADAFDTAGHRPYRSARSAIAPLRRLARRATALARHSRPHCQTPISARPFGAPASQRR